MTTKVLKREVREIVPHVILLVVHYSYFQVPNLYLSEYWNTIRREWTKSKLVQFLAELLLTLKDGTNCFFRQVDAKVERLLAQMKRHFLQMCWCELKWANRFGKPTCAVKWDAFLSRKFLLASLAELNLTPVSQKIVNHLLTLKR